ASRADLGDVFARELHGAGGRRLNAVESADQCGFAGTRESHHHEDLTRWHLKAGIDDCSGALRLQLISRGAVLQLLDNIVWPSAECLIDILNTDGGHMAAFIQT